MRRRGLKIKRAALDIHVNRRGADTAHTMLRLRVRAPFAAFSPARRALSSKAPALTLEQAMTSSHLILNSMQSPQALQALNAAQQQGDRLQKWQTANAVLIQSTLQALPQIGFTADGMGLQRYTEAFAEHARSDQPEVRKIPRHCLPGPGCRRWLVLRLPRIISCGIKKKSGF
jgi:hypothetical protein